MRNDTRIKRIELQIPLRFDLRERRASSTTLIFLASAREAITLAAVLRRAISSVVERLLHTQKMAFLLT